jgi:uncharacterized membrane protein
MMPILIFLHLAGVIVWVGGMFFAHTCLRPVAAAQLAPPQRLPLLAAVLGRFFSAVEIAVATIVGSGFAMMFVVSFKNALLHWHVMMATGLVMAGIFAYIDAVLYRRLKAAVAAEDWPAAGAAMEAIRKLVAFNLHLGVVTIAVATLGAYFGRG